MAALLPARQCIALCSGPLKNQFQNEANARTAAFDIGHRHPNCKFRILLILNSNALQYLKVFCASLPGLDAAASDASGELTNR